MMEMEPASADRLDALSNFCPDCGIQVKPILSENQKADLFAKSLQLLQFAKLCFTSPWLEVVLNLLHSLSDSCDERGSVALLVALCVTPTSTKCHWRHCTMSATHWFSRPMTSLLTAVCKHLVIFHHRRLATAACCCSHVTPRLLTLLDSQLRVFVWGFAHAMLLHHNLVLVVEW